MANRTGGYGYENTSHYTNTTLQFCNIQNIHAVRDSLQKLWSLCHSATGNDVQFGPAVEDSKWLAHIRTILQASWETAYWIHIWRIPVLLHCSHGWDRTSQVAALSQLLLDPYYRTLKGFAVLVEKDFMSFGHPFHRRCAHGEGRSSNSSSSNANNDLDEGQVSPIFIQFLDCVYQLVALLPNCFEFTKDYLWLLARHTYTCRFGTLLCDTEQERERQAAIRLRTFSVFDYLEGLPESTNADFDKEDKGVLLMPLSTLLRNCHLWTEKHCEDAPKPMQPTGVTTGNAPTRRP